MFMNMDQHGSGMLLITTHMRLVAFTAAPGGYVVVRVLPPPRIPQGQEGVHGPACVGVHLTERRGGLGAW